MKRKSGVVKCVLSVLLIILMSFSVIVPITASAAPDKIEKSYDIAVVYDNSGSMYYGTTQRWCRAKYAMEIFASMLDYKKDKLSIFPMWQVTTDGSMPDSGGSYSRIEIKSSSDVNKISNLYTTVYDGSTPFEPVTEAYNYLCTSTADEKWLLILTDGDFNQNKRNDPMAAVNVQNELSKLASNNIKVQYLGIDLDANKTKLKPDESRNLFVQYSQNDSLKDDLIKICNKIFQREELPSKYLSGNTLTLDMSMKSLIVFVQGADGKVSSLKDSQSGDITITMNSGQRKYSTISANGYPNAAVDRTLAGQVVTFDACPKGTYTLNYSGTDKIQIFYEPDVDIKVTLTNSDGQVIDPDNDTVVAGDYILTASIVDGNDPGTIVSKHALLGNQVKVDALIKSSADSEFKNCEFISSDETGYKFKVEFQPDLTYEVEVEGEYLGKYKISSKDDPTLAWLANINIEPPKSKFVISVSAEQNWYTIKDHDTWKPIRIDLTLDGNPLTDDQLANTKLDLSISDNLSYRCEPLTGESAYNVYIAQDENGQYIQPDTGKYKLTAKATYTDEFTTEEAREDSARFEIQKYEKFWRWLFWIIIIIVLIIIISTIMNIPTLPAAIYVSIKTNCQLVRVNNKRIGLSTNLYPGEIKCTAKPCTPLKNRSKTTASFEVKSLKPIPSVNWYELDGTRYKKSGSKYVNDDGETIEQVKPKVKITDDTSLKWNINGHTRIARILINHNN